MALVLGLLGVACLVATLLWVPAADTAWEQQVHAVLGQAWPVLITAAALVALYPTLRRGLLDDLGKTVGSFSDRLIAVVGLTSVTALPPKQVLETLLRSTHGDHPANQDVVTALLGGEGREPGGRGLTISTNTTVHFQLRADNSGENYQLTTKLTYRFQPTVDDRRFALFVTCDPMVWNSMMQTCRLALYESFFLPDPTIFHRSWEELRHSVKIGIQYVDLAGNRHDAMPQGVDSHMVDFADWPDYLTLFKEASESIPRLNPDRYSNQLKIFEFDLSKLAGAEHAVQSIEGLSLESTTPLRVDDGFCFWQAPYPCLVDRITFDATEFRRPDQQPFQFRVAPFTIKSGATPAQWVRAEQLEELVIGSWLLPGHGVNLLWRPGKP